MERLTTWWKSRSKRDQRAILLLALIVPVILFWYLITVPLQDRLLLAKRVLDTRRHEAEEVQKLIHEYSALRGQIEGIEFKASGSVVPEMERTFRNLPASDTRPILNRANVLIFGKSQPGVHIRIDRVQPRELWSALSLIASSGAYVSEIEINSPGDVTNEISASVKAWLPDRK